MAPLVAFGFSALMIICAGIYLTRYADAIAELTGLGRLLVGSILLAGATSLPELTIDLNAIRLGFPNLAVGDLVGSGMFNLLILALLDLSQNSRGTMLSRSSAAHALSGTMSLVMAALVAMFLLLGERLGPIPFGRLGIGTLVIAAAYIFGVRLVYFDQRFAARAVRQTGVSIPKSSIHTLPEAIIGFVIAAGIIVLIGPTMAEAAGDLAKQTGLGDSFLGNTLVAFSTSLPELVASMTAVRMGAFDLAIGNIFGSNTFNMVLLLPLDLAYPHPLLAHVSSTHMMTCLFVIIVTSVVVMGQLFQSERRRKFIEPDAFLVLGLIGLWLITLYALR